MNVANLQLALPHGTLLRSAIVAGFRVELSSYAPGERLPEHSHADSYFSVLLRGSYVEEWEGHRRECQPGMTVFHPAREKHSLLAGKTSVRIISVAIPRHCKLRLESHILLPSRPIELTGRPIGQLGYRLAHKLISSDENSALAAEGLILEILAELFETSPSPKRWRQTEWPQRLSQATQWLQDHFTSSISMSTLAREIGVHPVQLAREFRRKYQVTMAEFVRRLRTDYACTRLVSSSISVTDLALECGFADHSHFCRVFKLHIGVAPSRFRCEHRSGSFRSHELHQYKTLRPLFNNDMQATKTTVAIRQINRKVENMQTKPMTIQRQKQLTAADLRLIKGAGPQAGGVADITIKGTVSYKNGGFEAQVEVES